MVRLILNWKFLKIISRFFAILSARLYYIRNSRVALLEGLLESISRFLEVLPVIRLNEIKGKRKELEQLTAGTTVGVAKRRICRYTKSLVSVCLCLSFCLSDSVFLSVSLFVCVSLSLSLAVCLSVWQCLSVCLSVYLSICLLVSLYLGLSVPLFVFLSLSLCPSVLRQRYVDCNTPQDTATQCNTL